MKMQLLSKNLVNYIEITDNDVGQRLDNFLIKKLKGVPKNYIHRIIRSGEVRVNKGRAKPDTRIVLGDIVRIPPVRITEKAISGSLKNVPIPARDFDVIYEDDVLLVINKPSGVAVHGGSGVSFGVIEQLRQARPEAKYLELVHRLDKDTSGLLMIAKKRSALVKLHEMLRSDHPKKIYLALGVGRWLPENRHVQLPLVKYTGVNGEKMVRIGSEKVGQAAHTVFKLLNTFSGSLTYNIGIAHLSLLEVLLKTGRTHQIRVHMQANNCPIAGDERYGDYQANKRLNKIGLKRMFLHAYKLIIAHPLTGEKLTLIAPLPLELQNVIDLLESS